jgi:hypothetical protein
LIELETTPAVPVLGGHTLLAKAPTSSRVAPPGFYMLFVLSANRAPSVARIVRVP